MTIVNLTGRIVWGHPTTPSQKMKDGKPVIGKDGQPAKQFVFGLAVPKADAERIAWPVMYAEALKGFPSGQFPPGFAWKYKDANTAVDPQGKLYRERPGQADCWVFSISSDLPAPPPVVMFDPASRRYVDFPNIKAGDFAEVQVDFVYHAANKDAAGSKPGLYANPKGVCFLGYGEAIVSGPTPDQMFGDQPKALPPGASAIPVQSSAAPAMATPPGAPGAPLQPPAPPIAPGAVPPPPNAAAAPQQPPPPPATAYPSSAPPPPATDFVAAVAPHAVPPAPPAPPSAPVAPQPPAPPVDPNAPQIVRYDGATGKPVWRWPNGQEALGQ